MSRWFRDRELAIVIGVLLCCARLTKWAAKMVCYPIVYSTGSHAWPLYVATILCGAGVVMNVIYWFVMVRNGWATLNGKEIAQPKHKYLNRFGRQNRTITPAPSRRMSSSIMSQIADTVGSTTRAESVSSRFKFSYKLFLYVPGTFWMIPWIQLIMSSVLSSFDDVATYVLHYTIHAFELSKLTRFFYSEFVEFRFQTTSIMAGVCIIHYLM